MARSSPIVLFFLATCLGTGVVPIPPITSVFFTSDVRAQTTEAQKTEAERLLNLCREHLTQNQPEAAIQSCQQAVTAHQQIKDRAGEAKSRVNLGIARARAKQYEQAIPILQSALELAKIAGERRVEAIALNFLGLTYSALGKSQEAKEFLQQSLVIARELKDSQLEAGIQQALSSLEQPPQSPQKAEANQLLIQGWQYAEDANFQAALSSFEKALNIYQNLGERQGESETLIRMAWVYFQLGETKRSLDLYQQGLQIAREIGQPFLQSLALRNMGNSYLRLRQEEQAIEAFQEALDISRKARDLAEEARTLHDLTFFYRRKGQYQLAIQTYQQALTIFRDRDELYGQEHVLTNLGDVYVILNQYREAMEIYQQSLIIARKLNDRRIERAVLGKIGNLLVKQEQPELAIVFYKQAVNVTETIRQDIRDLPLDLQESYTETVAGTYRRLANLLLQQDRIFEAQQVLELLKLQEIQDFTRSQRARGEMAKVVMLPQEQAIIDSYGKVVTFGAAIAKCEQTNCPQLSALRDQRDELKRQYNQDVSTLETAIRQRTAQDDQFLLPTSFNQTADRIIQASDQYNTEPGTAVIYPLVLEDKLWLLWATEGKVIGKREITNVGRQKLNEEVLKLRLLLQKPDSDLAELQKSARQLYDWLIKPLEAELEAGNIQHLVFSLDRGFRYIPMAVLFDGEKYLIEKYTVTTFISAEFTDTQDRLPPNGADTPILGVGVAKAPGYDPLPNVTAEIDSIVRENNPNDRQGIYPGNQFLDGDFTFLSLRDNLKGRKLLHIATHGEFVPGDQSLSYLVLGNGEKLHIADIEILDDYLDDVHLVVLSACETALGDSFLTDPKQEEGIEINALSFYFLLDGAKTVMASLWRVDDTSTSLLMQRFYCTLANGNTTMTKAQALRKAQLSLLEGTQMPNCAAVSAGEQDFSHPHYWAPFILIGNGL